jgi:hypothetical protein
MLAHELTIPPEKKEETVRALTEMILAGEHEVVLPEGVQIRERLRPAVGHNDR